MRLFLSRRKKYGTRFFPIPNIRFLHYGLNSFIWYIFWCPILGFIFITLFERKKFLLMYLRLNNQLFDVQAQSADEEWFSNSPAWEDQHMRRHKSDYETTRDSKQMKIVQVKRLWRVTTTNRDDICRDAFFQDGIWSHY